MDQCTEVPFASFFSGGFINAIAVNPPEKTGETDLCAVLWTVAFEENYENLQNLIFFENS